MSFAFSSEVERFMVILISWERARVQLQLQGKFSLMCSESHFYWSTDLLLQRDRDSFLKAGVDISFSNIKGVF